MGFGILFKETLPLLNHQYSLRQAIEVDDHWTIQLPVSKSFEYVALFLRKWEHKSLIMSCFEPLIEILREQEKPLLYSIPFEKHITQSRSVNYTRHIYLLEEDQVMKMCYLASGSRIQEKVDLDATVSLTFVIVCVRLLDNLLKGW